jgi:hypothetical protein
MTFLRIRVRLRPSNIEVLPAFSGLAQCECPPQRLLTAVDWCKKPADRGCATIRLSSSGKNQHNSPSATRGNSRACDESIVGVFVGVSNFIQTPWADKPMACGANLGWLQDVALCPNVGPFMHVTLASAICVDCRVIYPSRAVNQRQCKLSPADTTEAQQQRGSSMTTLRSAEANSIAAAARSNDALGAHRSTRASDQRMQRPPRKSEGGRR